MTASLSTSEELDALVSRIRAAGSASRLPWQAFAARATARREPFLHRPHPARRSGAGCARAQQRQAVHGPSGIVCAPGSAFRRGLLRSVAHRHRGDGFCFPEMMPTAAICRHGPSAARFGTTGCSRHAADPMLLMIGRPANSITCSGSAVATRSARTSPKRCRVGAKLLRTCAASLSSATSVWRNTGWLKRHPWFESEYLPVLRAEVAGGWAERR